MDNENYICIFGQKIELLAEQVKKLKSVFAQPEPRRKLSELKPGDTFKLGEHEFVVLDMHEHAGMASVILKEPMPDMKFGTSNNFNGSAVDDVCKGFAKKLAAIVGEENLVEHSVDLLSDDGLDDYGEVERQVSLLTTQRYREYVKILDENKPDKWWWLATADSTLKHGSDKVVKCVSPRGYLFNFNCYRDFRGVRPFCILKSDIFVS